MSYSFAAVACSVSRAAMPMFAGAQGVGFPLSRPIQVTASSLGCKLDCDLNTGVRAGGGRATDNTVILNRFLAQGTATTPVHLIMDGGSAVTGIFLPEMGHASITGMGWDTGFYVMAGSNQDCIHNGGAKAAIPSDPSARGLKLPLATARGANVALANFRINGNRGDGTKGNSNSKLPQGDGLNPATWYFGINLMNLNNIAIENVWLYDIATYAIRLSNCSQSVIRGCRCESPSLSINTDGVHLDGGCSDTFISDCYFSVGDDSIALNTPEGYGGDIRRTSISNCIFVNCLTLLRLYTAADYEISGTVVSNCTASLSLVAFQMERFAGPGKLDGIRDLTVSGCTFEAPTICKAGLDSGAISFSGCTWISPAAANPWFAMGANMSSATLTGCRIYRTAKGHAGAFLASGTGNFGTLTLNGFGIENEMGQAYPPVDMLSTFSGGCGLLRIDALSAANITAFSNNLASFKAVAGAGVLATGWEWADSQIVNGTPYLSAGSHLPSIRIGGVVKSYIVP